MAKKQFKAESKRLLDIMINSIYTHKEIFLRELISNASDAIDKMNYKAIENPDLGLTRDDFRIDISVDENARTVTVSDNGIGMTKEEMDQNLGVIAHSGTLEFKKALDEGAESSIIGQFGVGFYSAFMVADKVTVVSKAFGSDTAFKWVSDGVDGYSITECQRDSVGTDVIMHIKADTDAEEYGEFLRSYRLQSLVKQYSDYIRWPIHMMVESGAWKETGETDEDGKPKEEYVTATEDKIINSMVPVWMKKKSEEVDKECNEFYKTKYRDFEDPISIIRANAEGAATYRAMLFIPAKPPYDYYTREFEPGLQLYSNGVLIMDKCEDLLPFCFRFVRGVVDSPDFSLNISREVLQHDRQLKAISANLTKKVKAELLRMLKDEPEKYKGFYAGFGRQLKYGVVDDYGSKKDLLADLLLFHSYEKNELVTLDQYVDSMKEGQNRIYYVSGDTFSQATALPQTEPVKDKGYDFLCLAEDVDGFVMRSIRQYRDMILCDISNDDLGIEGDEEKKDSEAKQEENKDLLEFMKEALGDKVSNVKISSKLKKHAVVLSSEGGITIEMEKYFRTLPDYDGSMHASYVLELNDAHPAFEALKKAFSEDKDKAKKMAEIMYDQARIISGLPLDDPVAYSDMVLSLF